jgi:hypothetical protein
MKFIATLITVTVLLSASVFSQAQSTTFMLVEVPSGKPLEGVDAYFHNSHNNVGVTDKKGMVKFAVDHSDTLTFFKKGYLPLYIQVKQNNFDTTHVVVLKLNAGSQLSKHKAGQFSKLNKAQYTFIHDSLSNSQIEVTHFEQPEISAMPNAADRSFHIVQINLDQSRSAKHRTAYIRK